MSSHLIWHAMLGLGLTHLHRQQLLILQNTCHNYCPFKVYVQIAYLALTILDDNFAMFMDQHKGLCCRECHVIL